MSYYDEYTASDARRDEYEDKLSEKIADAVRPMVDEVVEAVYALRAEIDARGADEPHPWPWTRHLLWIMEEDEDEDALREMLDEHFHDEAEERVRDEDDPGPCCNSFSCPCGNSNMSRA